MKEAIELTVLQAALSIASPKKITDPERYLRYGNPPQSTPLHAVE